MRTFRDITVRLKVVLETFPWMMNGAWLLLDRLARLAFGVLVGAWVARHLGPENYGELAYVVAWLGFAQAAIGLGMDGILVRELARDPSAGGKLLGTIFAARLVVAFLAWGALVLALWMSGGLSANLVLLAILAGGTLVFMPGEVLELWFQSQGLARYGVQARLLAYVISYGVKIILILANAHLLWFAFSLTIDMSLTALFLGYVYKKNKNIDVRWQFDGRQLILLLKESWPLLIGALAVMIYMRIDQIMIKHWLGAEALGVYAGLIPLATLWTVIPMSINNALAPLLARRKEQGEDSYRRTVENIFRYYGYMGWFMFIASAVSVYWMSPFLFGSAYDAGRWPVMIYCATNLIISMGVAQSLWIINEGRTKITLVKTVCGAISCIVLNMLFLPKWGLIGVACSAVASQCISAILCNFFLARHIFFLQVRGIFFLGARA